MSVDDSSRPALGRRPGPGREAAPSSSTEPPSPEQPRATAPPPSFDEFFRAEYAGLVVLLTAMSGSRAAAEELAQEAMLRAHVRWERIARYDRPGAWVRRVALNLGRNRWARRRSERSALTRLAQERPPDDPYGATVPDDEFWSVVRALPRRQAAAVALHYLEDLPVSEVAEVLGCAEGTAKVHLHRGRAALARRLDRTQEP
ncbi:MAG: sigma-70 family RNA polymerase sigma factor [Iamia sp.]